MEKRYHYLYRVTHIASNKVYVGIHSTNTLDDRYFACGVYLTSEKSEKDWAKINHAFENPNHIVNALIKYGPSGFKREILEFRDSREEILKLEEEVVTEDFVKSPNTFNHRSGGQGHYFSEETRALLRKNNPMQHQHVREKVAKAGRERWTEGMKAELSQNNPMYQEEILSKLSGENSVWAGREHSEETKRKISKKRKKQSAAGRDENVQQQASKTMAATSKKLTEIIDLKAGQILNSLPEVQQILAKEEGIKAAISTISQHLNPKSKISSVINTRFKFERRKVDAAPMLMLKRRGASFGFHVWIPWEKRYYKRSLATTDENEALKKLEAIQETFWLEPERKQKLAEFRAKPIVSGGGEKKRDFWRKNFEITDRPTSRTFNSYEKVCEYLLDNEEISVSENYMRELVNGRSRQHKPSKPGSVKSKLEGRFFVSKTPRPRDD